MQAPTSINQLLSNANGTLDRLIQASAQSRRLTSIILNFLPAPLNQHCQVGSIKDNGLVLLADSPVWSTMLRYQVPALLEHLRQQGFSYLCNIRTKTTPPQHRPSDKKTQKHPLSGETAALINDLASTMEHPELRDALQRLARSGAQ